MAVLARKITRAKWDTTDGLADGEIGADAVTADLRTIGNRLSFWTCTTPTDRELQDTVLALATAGDRLDKLDITWLSEQAVHGQGLALMATEGNTPVASLRNRAGKRPASADDQEGSARDRKGGGADRPRRA
jgi:hypothetical protein